MTELVYGHVEIPHDCFAVLPAAQARQLADEIEQVKACTTVGAARRLQGALELATVPLGPDHEELGDDAPFDWATANDTQNGDWPPMPTAAVLSWASADLLDDLVAQAGARRVHTTLNGDYLELPVDREDDLVRVLEQHDHAAVRDDALLSRLAPE